jgi:hypothetical protein
MTRSEVAARNGWDNTPNEQEIENLKRLAALLQEVKAAVGGKPVMINSGFGPSWSMMPWVPKTLASTAWAAQPTCGCLR